MYEEPIIHATVFPPLARPREGKGPSQGPQRDYPHGGDDWPAGTPHPLPGQRHAGQGENIQTFPSSARQRCLSPAVVGVRQPITGAHHH